MIGCEGPAKPDAAVTLRRAAATVNALETQPEFIVFTCELTHTNGDPVERRRRPAEFKSIVADLKVKNVRFMRGGPDAALDRGGAHKGFIGETFYVFDHKDLHFTVIDNGSDNVSDNARDAGEKIGAEPLA